MPESIVLFRNVPPRSPCRVPVLGVFLGVFLGAFSSLPAAAGCINPFIWDGSVGDWSEESRWLLGGQNNMGVPGAGDCALIGSGSVGLDSSVSVATLQLAGGGLSGLFDIDATEFEWTGGLVAGGDSANDLLTASAGCTISGGSQKQIAGRALICGGISSVLDSGTIFIGAFTIDAEIRVPTGAVMQLSGSQRFEGQGGSVTGSFLVEGTFERPQPEAIGLKGPLGKTIVGAVQFENQGTVRVAEGSLELSHGTSTGAFEARVDDQLVITFTSGTHQLLAGFSFVGPGFAGQSGGVVDVDGVGQAQRWRQLGGRLQGDSAFTIDYFEWSGGTLQGPGDKIVTASLALLGDDTKLAAGTFMIENRGVGIWQGSGMVTLDQSTFRNAGGASFEIQNAAVLGRGASQGFFENQGLLSKTSAGISSLQLDFTSSGTVEVQSGDLELRSPGTREFVQTAGSTSIAAGSRFLARSLELEGATLQVDGTVEDFSGPMNQITISSGRLTGDGTLRSNSVFTFQPGVLGGALAVVGNVFNDGGLAPGDQAPGSQTARLDVDGGVTLSSNSLLAIELGGLLAGNEFDQLTSTSTAALGGALEVRLRSGYLPQVGDSFTVLDAPTLGSFQVLDLPAGYAWQVDLDPVVLTVTESFLIFADGFESGDTTAWSATR